MRDNGGGNWTIRVKNIIALFVPPTYGGINNENFAIENENFAIENARHAYSSMFRGYSGFSEYFIWRDDFNERFKANEALDKMKTISIICLINHQIMCIYERQTITISGF
ncbi:hypothetical protein [Xenorhabdus sp. PB61.4]|uniref:hypothetical protein n=1 Tax=Xenorhabdus sp. PB61.4 TaxID=2788940 RepID=UPI001E4EC566|nr:hypothetical protein [Xenorhabdus sp. PB61.4]